MSDISTIMAMKALKEIRLQSKKNGYVYNGDIGLGRWRSALAKVDSGTNFIANVSVLGSSTVESQGSTNQNGFVPRLKNALANKYGNVGFGFIPTYHPNNWTFGGTWSDYGTYGVTARSKRATGAGHTAQLSFNGTGIVILTSAGTSGTTFTVSIDGGTATSFTSNNGPILPVKEHVVTGLSDGDHTMVLTVTGTGSVTLIGAYPTKGTKGIRVHML
jgi:hypothetical protein